MDFNMKKKLTKTIITGSIRVMIGDNLGILKELPSDSVDLIYVDPPFNTGDKQKTKLSSYSDKFDNFINGFLMPRMEEAKRLLKPTGSLFLHLDYREVHYAKVAMDKLFGRTSFINEIIWTYDYGGRATKRWSTKHDNILWYVKDPKNYCFNFNDMDRIPYMAPELCGPEKAARGKTPTDTWWHTIVPTNGYEKTGYPTQKPLGILKRIVKIHSNPGDQLLDFFAGSGSFGEAGAMLNRNVTLIDENPDAMNVMRKRFQRFNTSFT